MRNRVTPTGDIVAIELRCSWLGNRGILHEGGEIRRFHASDLWITCLLQFRGRHRSQWQPGHYTHLYFYDEAVAFAAGHRPCAECRRGDYNDFRAAWARGLGVELPRAKEMDRQLHAERLFRGTHRRRFHDRPWRSVPTNAFVLLDDGPVLVTGEAVVPWSDSGYGARRARPTRGDAQVITPPAILAAFEAGYQVQTGAAG
jgi:hypothetical protein